MVNVACAKHASVGEVVAQVRRALDGVEARLVLAFCGGKHEPAPALAALRAAFGDVPIVGGSAAGAIWRGGLSYSGFELGVAAFAASDILPQVISVRGLDRDAVAAGRMLGRDIGAIAADGSVVIFFYDSVAAAGLPLRLHPASAVVQGLQEGLGVRRVRLIGAGMLTDMNLSNGWIFDGREAVKHGIVALVFPPAVADETSILHGCRPVSTFMEITRIDGAEVYELDGEPALGVIERMLDVPLGDARMQELSLIATLGEKQGDPYAAYDENKYVNRLILRTNRATGSITLFEPDFRLGTRVQIMSRDNSLMLESVEQGVADLNRRTEGEDPLLSLYIDCAGRASARSGAAIEEAELVRRGLDPTIPLLGFYSGVEVAPFEGYSRPLDWTGVLSVLRRRR